MMQPDDVSLTIALQSVWDEEPQVLFAAVMSFWFGSRQISKMRHITDEGLGLIKRFEGFSPTIYLCSAGYPTIGFGHVVLPGEQSRFDGWRHHPRGSRSSSCAEMFVSPSPPCCG